MQIHKSLPIWIKMFASRRESLRLCQRCWKQFVFGSKQNFVPLSNLYVKVSTTANQNVILSLRSNVTMSRIVRHFTTSSTAFVEKSEEEVKLNIEENPYFDKYKRKIKDLQRSSPDTYQEKVEEIEEEMRKDRAFIKEQLKKAEAEAKAKAKTEGKTFPPESLDSIMKTELVKDKAADEIEEIWKEYHKKKDCVYAVMKTIDYDDLIEKARVCPSFLYPLPRQDGYEYFFSIISGKAVYFTPLIMYQRLKENAPPCLTLAHFTEFKDDKDIVLMTGQYDDSLLKREDALNLVRQMTLYYSRRSAERFNLVRIFNQTPEKFNPLDVINEYQEMIKFLESA